MDGVGHRLQGGFEGFGEIVGFLLADLADNAGIALLKH